MTAPSTDDTGRRTVAEALAQRLRAAADAALPSPPEVQPTPDADADACLVALVAALRADRDPSLGWLLLTVLTGAFPLAEDVRHVMRAVDLEDETGLILDLLDRAFVDAASESGAAPHAVVTSGVIVDVDMCARSNFHNGIQRTAREVVRVWSTEHEIVLTAASETGAALRSLTEAEHARAARWGEHEEAVRTESAETLATTHLVVPWHATLVLAEVPLPHRCARLAALAAFSGSRVTAIGYDAIPVISADLRPQGEPNGFADYLTLVKHAHLVAGISASATAEFRGFGSALAAQGLPGPDVMQVTLPATVPPPPPGYHRVPPARPSVLAVGRLEPHKNHGALLHAAERLWAEGVEFDLHLVGAPGWDTTRVEGQVERLLRKRAPLTWSRSVPDDQMWTLIRDASFTVFVSVHEGFGLPVAESLACGTPVLTTEYGSQGEIAAAGGCLTVDPRDDEAVLAALRDLVTRPELRAELRRQAAEYPVRTWDGYAHDLWEALITGGGR